MAALQLHDFHAGRGGRFIELGGEEAVASYGGVESEYLALNRAAAWLDLSFRGRVCVLGADRERFLHGQITNDLLRLPRDRGCYAALVNGKGRLQSDLFVYKLENELLLDFEPGLTAPIIQRLEQYIIADDVQVIDVAPHYGLLSVQGPEAAEVIVESGLVTNSPAEPLSWAKQVLPEGDLYAMNNPRFGLSNGYDLFVPVEAMERVADVLDRACQNADRKAAGIEAAEIARIENGVPRFGVDMDETNLAPEAEIASRAISYAKGCYIGQEIIARIRTYGQVAKALRLLRLPNELAQLPSRGEKLFKGAKEVGYLTSATISPKHGGKIALGYVRKEVNGEGEVLNLAAADGPVAQVIGIPGQS